MLGVHGVGGSNPPVPTIFSKGKHSQMDKTKAEKGPEEWKAAATKNEAVDS
jgi:hypothetical protein